MSYFTQVSINVGSLVREFYYSLPSVFPANNKCKVLICLHGAGGSGEQFTRGSARANNLIESILQEGYIVLAPSSRRDFSNVRWESETQSNPDVGFINECVTYLETFFNGQGLCKVTIDTDAIYILGGSSGGVMTSRMALQPNNPFAGIIIINACDANQVTMAPNGSPVFDNTKIVIPPTHPRTLLISSIVDGYFPPDAKAAHHTAIFNALGGAFIDTYWHNGPDAYHNWDTWVETFYPHIINWLKR